MLSENGIETKHDFSHHAFQRAQIEYLPEKIGQVLSIAKSIFPDLPEFNDATNAPSPNTR
jgi:hypothetical protein